LRIIEAPWKEVFTVPVDFVAEGDCITRSGDVVTHEAVRVTGYVLINITTVEADGTFHATIDQIYHGLVGTPEG
jgi:hypothetical protein